MILLYINHLPGIWLISNLLVAVSNREREIGFTSGGMRLTLNEMATETLQDENVYSEIAFLSREDGEYVSFYMEAEDLEAVKGVFKDSSPEISRLSRFGGTDVYDSSSTVWNTTQLLRISMLVFRSVLTTLGSNNSVYDDRDHHGRSHEDRTPTKTRAC